MEKNFESNFYSNAVPEEIAEKLKNFGYNHFGRNYYVGCEETNYIPIYLVLEWFSSKGWDIFYDRYFDFTEGVYSGYQGWIMKTDINNKKEGELVEFETDECPTKEEALLAAIELAIEKILGHEKENC